MKASLWPVDLVAARSFGLDAAIGSAARDQDAMGCTYNELPRHVTTSDVLLVNYNDGAIVLKVTRVEGTRVETLMHSSRPLANRKRINRPGGALSASALTGKHRECIGA